VRVKVQEELQLPRSRNQVKRIVEELSIKDAARRLGVSIRYIRDLVWSGQLEAEKTAGFGEYHPMP